MGGVHIVEHDGVRSNKILPKVMSGFRHLKGLIHSNVLLVDKPWMSIEERMVTSLYYSSW